MSLLRPHSAGKVQREPYASGRLYGGTGATICTEQLTSVGKQHQMPRPASQPRGEQRSLDKSRSEASFGCSSTRPSSQPTSEQRAWRPAPSAISKELLLRTPYELSSEQHVADKTVKEAWSVGAEARPKSPSVSDVGLALSRSSSKSWRQHILGNAAVKEKVLGDFVLDPDMIVKVFEEVHASLGKPTLRCLPSTRRIKAVGGIVALPGHSTTEVGRKRENELGKPRSKETFCCSARSFAGQRRAARRLQRALSPDSVPDAELAKWLKAPSPLDSPAFGRGRVKLQPSKSPYSRPSRLRSPARRCAISSLQATGYIGDDPLERTLLSLDDLGAHKQSTELELSPNSQSDDTKVSPLPRVVYCRADRTRGAAAIDADDSFSEPPSEKNGGEDNQHPPKRASAVWGRSNASCASSTDLELSGELLETTLECPVASANRLIVLDVRDELGDRAVQASSIMAISEASLIQSQSDVSLPSKQLADPLQITTPNLTQEIVAPALYKVSQGFEVAAGPSRDAMFEPLQNEFGAVETSVESAESAEDQGQVTETGSSASEVEESHVVNSHTVALRKEQSGGAIHHGVASFPSVIGATEWRDVAWSKDEASTFQPVDSEPSHSSQPVPPLEVHGGALVGVEGTSEEAVPTPREEISPKVLRKMRRSFLKLGAAQAFRRASVHIGALSHSVSAPPVVEHPQPKESKTRAKLSSRGSTGVISCQAEDGFVEVITLVKSMSDGCYSTENNVSVVAEHGEEELEEKAACEEGLQPTSVVLLREELASPVSEHSQQETVFGSSSDVVANSKTRFGETPKLMSLRFGKPPDSSKSKPDSSRSSQTSSTLSASAPTLLHETPPQNRNDLSPSRIKDSADTHRGLAMTVPSTSSIGTARADHKVVESVFGEQHKETLMIVVNDAQSDRSVPTSQNLSPKVSADDPPSVHEGSVAIESESDLPLHHERDVVNLSQVEPPPSIVATELSPLSEENRKVLGIAADTFARVKIDASVDLLGSGNNGSTHRTTPAPVGISTTTAFSNICGEQNKDSLLIVPSDAQLLRDVPRLSKNLPPEVSADDPPSLHGESLAEQSESDLSRHYEETPHPPAFTNEVSLVSSESRKTSGIAVDAVPAVAVYAPRELEESQTNRSHRTTPAPATISVLQEATSFVTNDTSQGRVQEETTSEAVAIASRVDAGIPSLAPHIGVASSPTHNSAPDFALDALPGKFDDAESNQRVDQSALATVVGGLSQQGPAQAIGISQVTAQVGNTLTIADHPAQFVAVVPPSTTPTPTEANQIQSDALRVLSLASVAFGLEGFLTNVSPRQKAHARVQECVLGDAPLADGKDRSPVAAHDGTVLNNVGDVASVIAPNSPTHHFESCSSPTQQVVEVPLSLVVGFHPDSGKAVGEFMNNRPSDQGNRVACAGTLLKVAEPLLANDLSVAHEAPVDVTDVFHDLGHVIAPSSTPLLMSEDNAVVMERLEPQVALAPMVRPNDQEVVAPPPSALPPLLQPEVPLQGLAGGDSDPESGEEASSEPQPSPELDLIRVETPNLLLPPAVLHVGLGGDTSEETHSPPSVEADGLLTTSSRWGQYTTASASSSAIPTPPSSRPQSKTKLTAESSSPARSSFQHNATLSRLNSLLSSSTITTKRLGRSKSSLGNSVGGMFGRVLFEFTAKKPDWPAQWPLEVGPLAVLEGDRIEILEDDGEWILGCFINRPDNVGYVPHSYVGRERASLSYTTYVDALYDLFPDVDSWPLPEKPLVLRKGQRVQVVSDDGGDWIRGFALSNPGVVGYVPRAYVQVAIQPNSICARALYEFDPTGIEWPWPIEDDDGQPLRLRKGDIIEGIIDDGSEWLFGRLKEQPQQRGFFPKEYVEQIDSAEVGVND